MVTELHECLSELRRELVGLLQVEAECLRHALEISKATGQGTEFDAAMRRVEATRTARGAILKRIHELEGRAAGGAAQFAGPQVSGDVMPDPAFMPPPSAKPGLTPHPHG